MAALLLASLVHIMTTAFNAPLDVPVAIVAAHVARHYSPNPEAVARGDSRSHLAIAMIDQDRYRNVYKSVSPLDRCALANDLRPILANPRIETVAIDLSLSPVDDRDTNNVCQSNLEAVLRQCAERLSTAAPCTIVTIVTDSPLDQAWMKRMESSTNEKALKFSNPALSVEFGMIRRHAVARPGELPMFADLLASRLCEKAPKPDFCDHSPPPGDRLFEHDAHASDPDWHTISFNALRTLYRPPGATRSNNGDIAIDDPCLTKAGDTCGVRHVLIGGSWRTDYQDDRRLTPVGILDGARIHAAIAAQPRSHLSHVYGFVADVVIGLLFGLIAHAFWGRYFDQRLMPANGIAARWRADPELAYAWLFALLFAFGAVLAGLLVICAFVYAHWALWISPVPMAVGMLIDGMVLGSVSVAQHRMANAGHAHAHAHADARPRPPWPRQIAVALPKLTAWLIVGLAWLEMYKG